MGICSLRFSFRKLQIFISQTTDSHFANYRFPFRKLQIFISQTTDSHFANYRFSFRKLQISISQTTDSHFVSSHFVSQTTVSLFFVYYGLRAHFVRTSAKQIISGVVDRTKTVQKPTQEQKQKNALFAYYANVRLRVAIR